MNAFERTIDITSSPRRAGWARSNAPIDGATLLTLPNPRKLTTSIRATAQVFQDPVSAALLERIRMNDTISAVHLHLSSLTIGRHSVKNESTPEISPQQALVNALHLLFEESDAQMFERIEETVMRTAFEFCHRNQGYYGTEIGVNDREHPTADPTASDANRDPI
eukprot:gene19337-19741_t